jgi:hypothetical protein
MAKKSAPRKRKIKHSPNGISKAQAIRDTAKELGKKARPRDIIAALEAKKIMVSSAQVSMTLKAAGLRRRRRGRKVKAAVANGQVRTFIVTELVQVKKLSEQVGGADKLKQLVGALERLF